MKKHFVTFFSPGTFVSEDTTEPIDAWNVDKAVKMSRKIRERYGATPYGFQFSTRSRNDTDLDSKVSKRSPMYFLGGEILTLKQVKDRHDPKDKILISNMEINKYERVIINTNSYRITLPLEPKDVVLDFEKSAG